MTLKQRFGGLYLQSPLDSPGRLFFVLFLASSSGSRPRPYLLSTTSELLSVVPSFVCLKEARVENHLHSVNLHLVNRGRGVVSNEIGPNSALWLWCKIGGEAGGRTRSGRKQ